MSEITRTKGAVRCRHVRNSGHITASNIFPKRRVGQLEISSPPITSRGRSGSQADIPTRTQNVRDHFSIKCITSIKGLLLVILFCAMAQAQNPTANVTVDANANRRAIDPRIYGIA